MVPFVMSRTTRGHCKRENYFLFLKTLLSHIYESILSQIDIPVVNFFFLVGIAFSRLALHTPAVPVLALSVQKQWQQRRKGASTFQSNRASLIQSGDHINQLTFLLKLFFFFLLFLPFLSLSLH